MISFSGFCASPAFGEDFGKVTKNKDKLNPLLKAPFVRSDWIIIIIVNAAIKNKSKKTSGIKI